MQILEKLNYKWQFLTQFDNIFMMLLFLIVIDTFFLECN